MTPCSSSRHTRPTPAASLVEVRGKRVPACNACIRALASNGVQGVIHPLPEPQEPTMADALQAVTDTIIAYADAVESAPPAAKSTPNRHLPLILRPDADAHPELCRVADCTGKVKARGACDQHLTALTRGSDPTAILLPRADRSEAARKAAAMRARVRGEAMAPTHDVEYPTPAVPVEDPDQRLQARRIWSWTGAAEAVPVEDPDQRLQAIAAELLADLDDVTDAGEAWGIHLVRALRLAVGVES